MQKLVMKLTNYVIFKGKVSEDERENFEYGFRVGLETLLSFIICMLIAIPLDMVIEGILFFGVFIPLRSYAGGLHLESYLTCLMLSCLTYTVILLVAKWITIPISWSVVLLLFLIPSVWLLYPVEHVNRPVDKIEESFFKRRLKQFLMFDILLSMGCLLFHEEKTLYLLVLVFLLVSITMLAGKVVYLCTKKKD